MAFKVLHNQHLSSLVPQIISYIMNSTKCFLQSFIYSTHLKLPLLMLGSVHEIPLPPSNPLLSGQDSTQTTLLPCSLPAASPSFSSNIGRAFLGDATTLSNFIQHFPNCTRMNCLHIHL